MTNVIQLKSNLLSSSAFSPSIYVKDITSKINSVKGIPTSFTAFVGLTKKGPINKPTQINSFYEFKRSFGELYLHHNLGYAVRHFFSNGGINAIIVSVGTEDNILPEKIIGQKNNHTGIYSLDGAKNFNILCIPPYDETETTDIEVYRKALAYCKERRAMLIVDPPIEWRDMKSIKNNFNLFFRDENAAMYFPRVNIKEKANFVPCGIVAGIIARTDSSQGVWKAPAGIKAVISEITNLAYRLSESETDILNQEAINCIKKINQIGFAIWGARTMKGGESFNSEWKYISARRTALFIEESLYRGLRWTTFEPNDEQLWSRIRSSVNLFLEHLFKEGAFVGVTSKESYFVKCDRETTIQNDIDKGIVNLKVGFAPLKPAEFIIIEIQLSAMT